MKNTSKTILVNNNTREQGTNEERFKLKYLLVKKGSKTGTNKKDTSEKDTNLKNTSEERYY